MALIGTSVWWIDIVEMVGHVERKDDIDAVQRRRLMKRKSRKQPANVGSCENH